MSFMNFRNSMIFMKKLKLVNALGAKFHKISSLARISLPCGVAFVHAKLFHNMLRSTLLQGGRLVNPGGSSKKYALGIVYGKYRI